MSFNWNDYIKIADELAQKHTLKEASCRSAISRAYYGAFCTARNYLQTKEGVKEFGENAHNSVRDIFVSSNDQNRREIGNKLNRLRLSRNKADYDNTYTVSSSSLLKETENALKNAKQIVDSIEKLIGGRSNLKK